MFHKTPSLWPASRYFSQTCWGPWQWHRGLPNAHGNRLRRWVPSLWPENQGKQSLMQEPMDCSPLKASLKMVMTWSWWISLMLLHSLEAAHQLTQENSFCFPNQPSSSRTSHFSFKNGHEQPRDQYGAIVASNRCPAMRGKLQPRPHSKWRIFRIPRGQRNKSQNVLNKH